jgi:hypothetical protein
LDFLNGTLCISIGCAVAWLLALYTDRGVSHLIWDTLFGWLGAAVCVWTIAWVAPALGVVGLLAAGPFFSLAAIRAGDSARRRIATRFR